MASRVRKVVRCEVDSSREIFWAAEVHREVTSRPREGRLKWEEIEMQTRPSPVRVGGR